MWAAEPITLIWYFSHALLFVWFSIFMSPIQHSDRGNVTYFWTVSCSTLVMLISSIGHAPRLIHSNSSRIVDIVAFAWTLLPVSGILLHLISKVACKLTGYSITSSFRLFLSNTLLVTIALSLQYMTCIDQGYYTNVGSVDYLFLDVPRLHCRMMETPSLVWIPIVLTLGILVVLSQITGRLFGANYKFFQYKCRRHVDPIVGRPPIMLPMVPWFSLSLTTTAIQLLVTLKMFVGRLDIRHILNALCREDAGAVVFDLRQTGGEWLDFFADGGDGFNSTYGIARLMAQPNLKVSVTKSVRQKCALSSSGANSPSLADESIGLAERPFLGRTATTSKAAAFPPPSNSVASMVVKRHTTSPDGMFGSSSTSSDFSPFKNSDSVTLPRPQVVVHGGDLAYPRPSHDTYKARFVQPIEAAFPAHKATGTDPQMFIIPGNHDWYDGLEAFMHWIVGKDNVGGWRLPQKSSYFCLRLSRGWWVFGLDVALSNDLDIFQYQSMLKVLQEQVSDSDRVLVVCHRPQWLFDPYSRCVTGELYHQLLDKIGPNRLRMRLAGDMHNYSRFSAPSSMQPHLVTSGGAGAFLHPTHVPGESIVYEYFEARQHKTEDEDSSDEEDDENDTENSASELSEDEIPTEKITTAPPFSERPPNQRKSFLASVVGVIVSKIPRSFSGKFSSSSSQKEFYRYRRASTYPCEETSRRLTWMNPLHFRDRNWGADMILGTVYVCVGVSVLPLCGKEVVDIMRESPTLWSAILNGLLTMILKVILPAFQYVWTSSQFSLGAQIFFCALCFSACKSHRLVHRIAIASTHWLVHVLASITIFACIEVGIEFLALLSEGRDSMISDGFRVPGLVTAMDAALFSAPVFETFLSQFLRFIDLPSSLIRNRQLLCSSIDRQLMFRYLWRVLPFFWLIATPIAALVTGTYLLISLNWFGLHLNEAFSSLRIEDYKNFIRMRIDPTSGDLHCYVIGVDQMPKEWEKDPAWDPTLFASVGQTLPPSSRWVTPSKWRPKGSAHSDPSLVDYFIVRR